jgi:hypothetical protein
VVVTALARRCSNCGENLIMNLAIEKELKCTIPVCMICYQSIIRNSYAMGAHNNFMYGRLGGRNQGNVKKETNIGNRNRENGENRQGYEI